jgi:hypothetical protein
MKDEGINHLKIKHEEWIRQFVSKSLNFFTPTLKDEILVNQVQGQRDKF